MVRTEVGYGQGCKIMSKTIFLYPHAGMVSLGVVPQDSGGSSGGDLRLRAAGGSIIASQHPANPEESMNMTFRIVEGLQTALG